jgi:hypothetical protein
MLGLITIAIAVVALKSRTWDWSEQGTPGQATDYIHVGSGKCLALAAWELGGHRQVELTAQDARRIEQDLVACGARIERKGH